MGDVLRLLDLLRLLLLIVYKVLTMSYESFIIILLTAITVILAALATIIAIVAIVGWAGFKESIKDNVAKHVGPVMEKKLKEYPDAAKFVDMAQRLESHQSLLEDIQSRLVNPQESKPIATASNSAVQEGQTTEDEGEASPINIYPGEEQQNVNTTTAAPAASAPAAANAGPDHTESPENGSS